MATNNTPFEIPKERRPWRGYVASAVGGFVGLVVLANAVIWISFSITETYSACSEDLSICVTRNESLDLPGFAKMDRVGVYSGPGHVCGGEGPTPFAFRSTKFKAIFHDGYVEVRGDFKRDRVFYTAPVC